MKLNKYLKKKIAFFCFSFFFLICIVFVTSYVVVMNQKQEYLEIGYSRGNEIVEVASYPLSLEEGVRYSPINKVFIKNKSLFSRKARLIIKNKDTVGNLLTYDKIYYSVNGSTPALLSDAKQDYVYEVNLRRGEKVELVVQVWSSLEKIENEDQGKQIALELEVK